MKNDTNKFPGFPAQMRKNFWMYPRVMDAWWHELSGSEQKCLDFILRRLWGWEKTSDYISLSQFQRGGGRIGKGTGLSQRQIVTAVHELEAKGYIRVIRLLGKTNKYSLVVQEMQRGHEETATGTNKESANDTNANIAYTLDKVPIDTAIEKMYSLYTRMINSGIGVKLTQKARKNLTARFGEYHPEELILAMKNASEDDYWGDIVRTNTIAWFFASEERIATFLTLVPHHWEPKEKQ